MFLLPLQIIHLIHDIPLSYGANENMFRDTSFVSTYILVVWGEQVCGLKRKCLGTAAFEYFIRFLDPLLALKFC